MADTSEPRPGNDDPRQRLARAQADLVRALLDNPATPPAGFDPNRVKTQAIALAAKARRHPQPRQSWRHPFKARQQRTPLTADLPHGTDASHEYGLHPSVRLYLGRLLEKLSP